jgi:PAS domain S-box-containing protein
MALDNERIEQRSSAARVVLVVQAGADRAQALAGLLRGLPSDAAALALLPPGEIRALRGAFGGLVETARDGLTLRPGLVVAVPADAIVLAHGGRLRVLRDMVDEGGAERIDRLLASLAALPAPRIVFLRLGAASGGGRSALALQEAGGRIVVEGENGDPFARAADLRGPIGTALAATRGYLGAGVAPPFALDAASRDPSMPQRPFGPLGCDARLDALSEALPPLVKAAGARGRPLRIWVQGCDTPELAYAVAVRALEAAAGSHAAPPPEVIVTDSDLARLDRARAGILPPDLSERADPTRLAQHFRSTGTGWQPHCALRARLSFMRFETRTPGLARMDAVVRGDGVSGVPRSDGLLAAHAALVEGGLLIPAPGDVPPAGMFRGTPGTSSPWRRRGPPPDPAREADGLAIELDSARAGTIELGRMLRGALDDLQNLVAGADLTAVILDDDLRLQRATEAAGRLLRLGVGDMGRPVGETPAADADPAIVDEARGVIERHVPAQALLEIAGRSYARRLLPYRTDGDRVMGVVAVFNDVTDLQLSERAADAARGYARTLVQTTCEPFVALDAAGRVVEASAAFLEAFGYREDEVMDRALMEVDGGAWRGPALEAALIGTAAGAPPVTGLRVEHGIGRAAGRRLRVNLRRTAEHAPGGALILMAVRDVTEHERQRERLVEQDVRIAALTETAGGAVLTIDGAGRIVEAGTAAAVMFDHPPDALLGRRINLVLPDGGVEAFRRALVAPGRRIAVDGLRRDGVRLPLDLAVDAVRADGEERLTGVLRDLSAELVRQEELRRLRAMEAIGRLTGGVAHDFGNLLTVIGGNLGLVDAGPLSGRDRARLAEARDAVAIGAQLTRQLLSLGGGAAQPPAVRTDVNAAAAAAAELARLSLRPGIALELCPSDAAWLARADGADLRAALLNLMLNASDAMPSGGRLRIETRNLNLSRAEAALHVDARAGAFAVVSVRDDGLGMSPEVRGRATEPFYTTKPEGRGTGLGLSTAYAFARRTGGFLTIDSAPGAGTTVTLHLPQAAGDGTETEA